MARVTGNWSDELAATPERVWVFCRTSEWEEHREAIRREQARMAGDPTTRERLTGLAQVVPLEMEDDRLTKWLASAAAERATVPVYVFTPPPYPPAGPLHAVIAKMLGGNEAIRHYREAVNTLSGGDAYDAESRRDLSEQLVFLTGHIEQALHRIQRLTGYWDQQPPVE